MCGHSEFNLIEGLVVHSLQQEPNKTAPSKEGFPVVATVCKNCGFVASHALGALEELPGAKGDTKAEDLK